MKALGSAVESFSEYYIMCYVSSQNMADRSHDSSSTTTDDNKRSIYFTQHCIPEFKRQMIRRKTAENSHMKRPTKKKCINLEKTGGLQIIDTPLGPAQSHPGVRLGDTFFNVPCEELAKSLLGKVLVRRLDDGSLLKGRIVETESYLGGEDKASHSYNGRRTERNEPMFMNPGTAYVYLTYGMYHCFNISSKGEGSAVLLRAVEPLEGLNIMEKHRLSARKNPPAKALKPHELCNGPAKLCISMAIDKQTCNAQDLTSWSNLWVECDAFTKVTTIITSTRIGIDSVDTEWAKKPLRFYLFGNRSVSRLDKVEERKLQEQLQCIN